MAPRPSKTRKGMKKLEGSLAILVFAIIAFTENKSIETTLNGLILPLLVEILRKDIRTGVKFLPYNVITAVISLKSVYFYLGVQLVYSMLMSERYINKTLHSHKGEKKTLTAAKKLAPEGIEKHSAFSFFSTLTIEWWGTEMNLLYIGNPDLSKTPRDYMSVEEEFKEVRNALDKAAKARMILFYVLIAGFATMIVGFPLVLVISMLYGASGIVLGSPAKIDHDDARFMNENASPVKIQDGIYKIYTFFFGIPIHRGVGYAVKGTFYTRYHVTHANPIALPNGTRLKPTYINRTKDNIAYGDQPVWFKVEDGEELLVALAGGYSNSILLYKSIAKKDGRGCILFRGSKSMEGCSGSPVFRERVEESTNDQGVIKTNIVFDLVGTVGWYFEDVNSTNTGIEIMAEERTRVVKTTPSRRGEIQQIFQHPGSGKTRKVMPDQIKTGLISFPKVYVTGPTTTVCKELYGAVEEEQTGKVSLVSSVAEVGERGSLARPIVMAAHATMLSMLLRGAANVRNAGLWIMDEAHYMSSASLMLKDLLRNMTKKGKCSLTEMTATGFDIDKRAMVIKKGSVYDIEDISMSDGDMIEDIIEHAEKEKVLVFCTGITSKKDARSIVHLKDTLKRAGIKSIELSRRTFKGNYPIAKEMSKGAILSTDICECGANLNVTRVYDFQQSWKPMHHGNQIEHELTTIDVGQMVQRRGRCGRRSQGTYISPGRDLLEYSVGRAELLDRAVFANSMGIEVDDITSGTVITDFKLTPQQVAQWIRTDDEGMEGPWTVDLLIDANGRMRSGDDLERRIDDWLRGDEATIKIGRNSISVSFYDARDEAIYRKILASRGIGGIKIGPTETSLKGMMKKLWRNLPSNIFKREPEEGGDAGPELADEDESRESETSERSTRGVKPIVD